MSKHVQVSRNGTDHAIADEVEIATLSVCLKDPSALAAIGELSEDDFRLNAHRWIFRGIRNLTSVGKVADFTTLADWLNEQKQIGQRGQGFEVDYSMLGNLKTFRGTSGAVSQYVAAVRSHAEQRRALYATQEIRGILDSEDRPERALREIRLKLSTLETSPADNRFPEPIPASNLAPNGSRVDWVWPGYVALSAVTLLTAIWKKGKSTLLGHLFRAMGRDELLAGSRIMLGKVLVVAEESQEIWAARRDELGIGNHASFYCQLFNCQPSMETWLSFVRHLAQLVRKNKIALVVLDTLAKVAPWQDENDAAAVLAVLSPLHEITQADAAVLITHHPRKGGGLDGEASRGSGALPGFVDIIIEMRGAGSGASERQRELTAYSRYKDTPKNLIIELSEDGQRYCALGSATQVNRQERWRVISEILPGGQPGLTVDQMLSLWPTNDRKPGKRTLQQDLKQGALAGNWNEQGSAVKGDPLRYWRKAHEIRAGSQT